ncbi:hypothetical protein ACFQ2B_22660 [Streptomyces stramineus]|uniref:hypothetical protein n=1 Tax=Streptomyces stramineus TaxID=173861 RepID=UPI0031D37703
MSGGLPYSLPHSSGPSSGKPRVCERCVKDELAVQAAAARGDVMGAHILRRRQRQHWRTAHPEAR